MVAEKKLPPEKELIRLISSIQRIKDDERKSGKGKLRETIQKIKSREPFFDWPVVFLPGEGEAVFIGDTHGDSLASQAVIRQEDFYNKIKSGQKIYLVWLGDYADRGREDIKNLEYLLNLKKQYPQNVFLLRGNHEEQAVSQYFGLLGSCLKKFGYEEGQNVFQKFIDLFEKFPNAVVTANGVVAVHGGIPIGEINSLTDLADEENTTEIRWNDPTDEIDHFVYNYKRGCNYLFGKSVFKRFMLNIGAKVLVRSHEYVSTGYKLLFDDRLLSIFSNGGTSPESGYRDFILYPKYAKVDLSKPIGSWSEKNVIDIKY